MITNEVIIRIVAFFILGLLTGSFLNVIIYRLPMMLQACWRIEARELLGQQPDEKDQELGRFNLAFPPSHCTSCHEKLKFYEKIPLLSYILQKGRCRHCQDKISFRYPLVESFTGFVFALMYYRLGWGLPLLGGIFFASILIVIALVDLRTTLIPDVLSISLLWSGLLFNAFAIYKVPLKSAVLGAAGAYLFFWLLFYLVKWLFKKEAIGFGDLKLFAALGAWLGILSLPTLVLLSSLCGLVLALLMKPGLSKPLPFGPAIVLAGLVMFIFGPEIMLLLQGLYV
ncbi:MAG: prepilin peptidase [Francisella sp.]|jgi:type 4 prepilin-like proteins leader peptide-processing enzyme|nr:MAG: prepilin peptidase [Francisella sp.]